jgi:hypothetical protein
MINLSNENLSSLWMNTKNEVSTMGLKNKLKLDIPLMTNGETFVVMLGNEPVGQLWKENDVWNSSIDTQLLGEVVRAQEVEMV